MVGPRVRNNPKARRAVDPGLYHYRREQDGREMRMHLRVEEDGKGLLSVNASGVIHLNETAALLMKLILDGMDRDEAAAAVSKVYIAKRGEVERDYNRIQKLLRTMETTEDACPVMHLGLRPSAPPFGHKVCAPYRADLALTYACNDNCTHCYVARRPEDVAPLKQDEWNAVLARLWDVGVPHVCFTGGEATLCPFLPDLVEKAEDIGLITGLLTNGRRLADREYTRRLCAVGLDHVQITVESHDPAIHDTMVGCEGAHAETIQGLENALEEDLYLVTNTTLCRLNVETIEQTLAFLKQLGVRQFAMNSIIATGKAPASGVGLDETELEAVLGLVSDTAEDLGMRFIWYSPTHYCELNPTLLEIGYKRCTAAEYNICIEPDGQVLPCQSYYKPVGHILNDDWNAIWNSPLFLDIRERKNVPEDCRTCPDFDACGSGCPLSSGEQFLCTDSHSEG